MVDGHTDSIMCYDYNENIRLHTHRDRLSGDSLTRDAQDDRNEFTALCTAARETWQKTDMGGSAFMRIYVHLRININTEDSIDAHVSPLRSHEL